MLHMQSKELSVVNTNKELSVINTNTNKQCKVNVN